jgi:hypothetical protein
VHSTEYLAYQLAALLVTLGSARGSPMDGSVISLMRKVPGIRCQWERSS